MPRAGSAGSAGSGGPGGAGAAGGSGGGMGVVESLPGPIVALRQYEDQKTEVEQEMLRDIGTLMTARGRGWFRRTPTLTVSGEGRGSFVFVADKAAERDRVKSATEPAVYYKFISGTRDETGERVRMQRTWFAYYEPVGLGPYDLRPAAPPKGVVVLLPGLFGTPVSPVNQVVHAFRDRGWAVLRMLAHSSRFTEEATWVLGDDGDIEPLAESIAQELGDRAAECAYAVEDVLAAAARDRPALAGLPRFAVGMSGGAMVLPTVVARDPGAWSGAVMIAGGADFLSVALRSNYTSWINALRFRRSDGAPLTPEQQDRLVAAYRERAPLDSLYTIDALAGKPVLMLHASGDQAVPADLGDLLWDRAGRPERWVFQTGHELIFLALPLHVGRMVAWVEEASATHDSSAPAAAEARP